MTGLVPVIHSAAAEGASAFGGGRRTLLVDCERRKLANRRSLVAFSTWMAGTRPAMTDFWGSHEDMRVPARAGMTVLDADGRTHKKRGAA
jgi:hypothetical protein